MRIIAGEFRGRRLDAPKGKGTRPTTDRIRESLFNWLEHHPDIELQGARIGDFFAGTGALGLEALSRGAAFVTFFETDRAAIEVLKQNIENLGVESRCQVLRCDATRMPKAKQGCDIVFLDPPYGKNLEEKTLRRASAQGWLNPHANIILESESKDVAQFGTVGFKNIEDRVYGNTRITLMHLLIEN